MVMASVFIAALVVCNVIASKFVTIELPWLGTFVVSAGVLPYPLTFLVTDLLSEVYGKQRANQVVVAGFVASMFTMLALWLGDQFAAIANSPVDDPTYFHVFSKAPRAIAASMVAYLVAQFVDIRLFHFWKRVTNGRHLWLRNNASTITSQLLDTVLVVVVLFWGVDQPGWFADSPHGFDWYAGIILDTWSFKVLCALADTPFIYAVVHLFARYGPTEELLAWQTAPRARV
ncbi:MAG: queuosine precursor transporter [Planctomycetes bacterium]|nr:queuosine precursor transporter [Planctomycetota bacterium]